MDNLNQKLYVPIFVLVDVPFVLLKYELSLSPKDYKALKAKQKAE